MNVSLDQLWLTVFVIDTTRYLVGVGIVSIALFVVFRRFSETHRIQRRRASGADIRRELTYSLLTTAVYACVALVTVQAQRSGLLKVYENWGDYHWLYGILSLPLVLVLHDAWFYWVHRLLHHPWLFRRVHRVHHLSRTPTPWAAYSFAPGEAVAMAIFVPLVALVIPVHQLVLFSFLAIMIVRNAMGHSGVEFHPQSWIETPLDHLTTVTHHDLHHQRLKGNYGLYFTWWDRWMGTEFEDYHQAFRAARAGEPAATTQPGGLEVRA